MCCFLYVQVMNLHSCIQVNVDFVSPEHAHNSYYLTQELRSIKDQVNYEDKLQVTAYFYLLIPVHPPSYSCPSYSTLLMYVMQNQRFWPTYGAVLGKLKYLFVCEI